MIKKFKQYIYNENNLKTSIILKLFGFKVFEDITESNCPCDLEAVERTNNKNNDKNGKVGFKKQD